MKTNWPGKKLGEVAEINPKKSELNGIADSMEVSFIPMQAVDDISGTITDSQVRKLRDVKKGYTYFKNNDVLFAKITPCMQNGKIAIARNLKNDIGFGSTEFHVIRPSNQILSEWIYLLIRQKSFREEAEKHMTGTAGQQRVPKEYLENLEIPVPGVEEQRRIVKKLEKILAKIEEASSLRQGSVKEVKLILKSASAKTFFNKKFIKRKVKEIATVETLRNKNYKLPYIGMEDIESDTGRLLDNPKVKSVKSTTFYFDSSHVLYGKLRPYLNKVFLPSFEGHCTTEFIPLKPKQDLNRAFLELWLRSPHVAEKLSEQTTGTRMPRADMDLLMDLEIPLPELKEQGKIVTYLDGLSEKVQSLKKLQEEQLSDLDALKASVLHQAFERKL